MIEGDDDAFWRGVALVVLTLGSALAAAVRGDELTIRVRLEDLRRDRRDDPERSV